MYWKNNATIAQIANQLIWAAFGMRKLNNKQANVFKKQCKYSSNCQSGHLGGVWDAKVEQKTRNLLKKQCKYSTNCKSAEFVSVWDAKIPQKIKNMYWKLNANNARIANQLIRAVSGMRTKKKQSKCIEKPRQILHKIPINCSGLHVGCENSTKPQEIVMKSTNANIAPLGRRTGCNNPTTNKDMY